MRERYNVLIIEDDKAIARLLRDNPDAFGGVLCVVNLDIDPSEVWDYLSSFKPRSIDLLLPLATGAEIVMVQRDTAMDGNRLCKLLEQEQITFLQATPGMWQLLLKSHPRVKVLDLCQDGREAFLWDLRQHRAALGEASPAMLLDVVRKAT